MPSLDLINVGAIPDDGTGDTIRLSFQKTNDAITEVNGITFLTSIDTPSSYAGQGSKSVRVNVGETALEFVDPTESYLGLSDTPSSYAGEANKTVRVNVGESALEFVDSVFTSLTDTPASYSGEGGKSVRVNVGESALEFVDPVADFTDLGDTPASYAGQGDKSVRVNSGATALEFVDVIDTFTGLTDTPASYSGQTLKLVRVNAGETALEFTDPPVGPGSWTNSTPATGFSAPGAGLQQMSYRSNGDAVEIAGLLVRSGVGLTPSGTVLFNLPLAFRPTDEQNFLCRMGGVGLINGNSLVTVETGGDVTLTNTNFLNTNDEVSVHLTIRL